MAKCAASTSGRTSPAAAGEVRPDVDAAHFATGYCSTMFGTIYQWVVAPEAIDLEAFFEHYAAVVQAAISYQVED